LQSYDFQVLTTGFSYTFAAGTTTLIAAPAGTLATGTITMPGTPADGMVITIESTQQVTAVTVQGNTGQSLVGGASQLIPNQPLSYIYRQSNTTWYPMAGGAGRATAVASGTSVASTSGTSIDFTGIPSWVKRITVMLNNVSLSGGSTQVVRLGTSGGFATTGYNTMLGTVTTSNNTTRGLTATAYFPIQFGGLASYTISGNIVFTNVTGTVWTGTGIFVNASAGNLDSVSGDITLGAALTQIRITTVNGTDTFDAGSINIFYE